MPFVKKRVLSRHVGSVSRARWTDDGKYVITCGFDKSLRLWNPFRNEVGSETDALHIKEYSGVHGHEVVDVAIAKDNGSFVSCGGDKACFLWDVTGGHIIRRFEGHAQRVNAVTLNKEDSVLISGSYDQSVRLWDLRSRNREPIQILTECKDSVSSVDVSDHEVLTGCVDGSVRIYDMRTGGTIVLIDKATGNILHSYHGHIHESYSLQSCLTYNDSQIISGSENGIVYIWDMLSGELKDELSDHQYHRKAVTGVASHPKEDKLITSSLDGASIYWESVE